MAKTKSKKRPMLKFTDGEEYTDTPIKDNIKAALIIISIMSTIAFIWIAILYPGI